MVTLYSIVFTLLATPSLAQNWDKYPHVPKTASINGFADSIYAKVPACAEECLILDKSTGNTPCPYWDTGCLCIMPQFIGPVAECVASKCSGNDVAAATSVFSSNCKRVGAWFSPAAADVTLLQKAENRKATATASSSYLAKGSAAPASATGPINSPPLKTSTSSSSSSAASSSTNSAVASSSVAASSTTSSSSTSSAAAANPWATYPHVPQTASINGFADSIYAKVPACAEECLILDKSTGNTPCPYWDTGCLCIMPQFIGPVAECVASKCAGNDVAAATSVFSSNCKRVGAWFSPAAADVTLLRKAENRKATATASSSYLAKGSAAPASATGPSNSPPLKTSIPSSSGSVYTTAASRSFSESTYSFAAASIGTTSVRTEGHSSSVIENNATSAAPSPRNKTEPSVTTLITSVAGPTTFTAFGQSLTVLESTVLTITDCGCTKTDSKSDASTSGATQPTTLILVTTVSKPTVTSTLGATTGITVLTMTSCTTVTNDSSHATDTLGHMNSPVKSLASQLAPSQLAAQSATVALVTTIPTPTVIATLGTTITVTESTVLTITACTSTASETRHVTGASESTHIPERAPISQESSKATHATDFSEGKYSPTASLAAPSQGPVSKSPVALVNSASRVTLGNGILVLLIALLA